MMSSNPTTETSCPRQSQVAQASTEAERRHVVDRDHGGRSRCRREKSVRGPPADIRGLDITEWLASSPAHMGMVAASRPAASTAAWKPRYRPTRLTERASRRRTRAAVWPNQ